MERLGYVWCAPLPVTVGKQLSRVFGEKNLQPTFIIHRHWICLLVYSWKIDQNVDYYHTFLGVCYYL